MSDEVLSQGRLNRALLDRQMLLDREDGSALSVIERLVGLQAQQPQPPFVGLWTRLVQFERDDLLGLLAQSRGRPVDFDAREPFTS